MLNAFFTRIFGSRNERILRKLRRRVDQINALEESHVGLTDEELQAKTAAFRERLNQGESLNDLLPEAFATVREAAKRVLGMRHYDVQLIGAMVLNNGKIAEMRTGEGKTLMATLAVYLNALPGKGVHVITVNDYLAKRDAAWMGKLYEFLGLSVGVVYPNMPHEEKTAAYAADITYGTNNEFGFDYLRDNMALRPEDRFQRALHYAIIDEVDSVLIDEARTPLIISGQADDSPELYAKVNRIVPHLTRQETEESEGDFWVDEKQKQIHLSEEGMEHAEELLRKAGILNEDGDLYAPVNLAVVHHLNAAIRAHAIYQRDTDYIVRDGEVIIVDEFTGRTMAGRRWSDGLHQAVEAKEGVPIQKENQTLASITFQNYFRMYDKLSGMTGTADTEAYEFQQIYSLETVVIPTHKPMIRDDRSDLVYLKRDAKWNAIVEDIRDCQTRKQPVLVGTTSIETSELLSGLLRKSGISHEVLNAKQHERESIIVAQAGRPGSVTIATNMAGRGTDIVLGGNWEMELEASGQEVDATERKKLKEAWKTRHDDVLAAGGLHIIGTERHESRRIDNQLRGRAGRQGDPGSSRFYLSLEDPLMRIFAGDFLQRAMARIGMQEDEAIEHKMVSKQIENAQRKVEAHNFDIRKNLLEYDDVANDQRKVVYAQRNELLELESIQPLVQDMREEVVTSLVHRDVPPQSIDEQWNLPELERVLTSDYGVDVDIERHFDGKETFSSEDVMDHVQDSVDRVFREKEAMIGSETMRHLEKHVMLNVLDTRWKEHLAQMDYLRQGIHLRSYAQRDPKKEYQREAFEMFSGMLDQTKQDCIKLLAILRVRTEEEVAQAEAEERRQQQAMANQMEFQHASSGGYGAQEEAAEVVAERQQTIVREGPKVGRNDPCICGSGKKYKHCCGKLA